jgi:hypothetical protein
MTPTTNNREHNNRELTDTELLGVCGGTGTAPAPGVSSTKPTFGEGPVCEPLPLGTVR